MIETKYLVLSWENHCVFTVCNNPASANALAASNINSVVRCASKYMFRDFAKISNREVFKESIFKLDNLKDQFVTVSPDLISDSWKAERAEIWLRQDAFALLEMYEIAASSSVSKYHNTGFMSEVYNQLSLCSPSTGYYTNPIEEYARILNVPVNEVYKELKLKYDGSIILSFRIAGLVEKWTQQIQRIKTQAEFNTVRTTMFQEFWGNSQI